ncbi:MAG: ATP-binding protein [Candidatus Dormibacteraceae bacterium]
MVSETIKAPETLQDLNLHRDLVASLVLRTLAFYGQLSGADLEEKLGVTFETIGGLLEEFQRTQLVDSMGYASRADLEQRPVPVRLNYMISNAGRSRAAEMAAIGTRYLGPCPITFEDYVELIGSQFTEKVAVTDGSLRNALEHLELDQNVIDQIGGAMVSRASLFIFGAPGNGKSTVAERMSALLGGPIEIPHAVTVGDEVIRVLDPVYHRPAPGPQPADGRLVRVHRPVVIAGGELKLPQLDLTHDAQSNHYEAPLQWKANGGVLVIDDFGRQEAPAMRFLNRFIVPMERKVDYLDLSASGRKISLPFLCQIVFSTNLSPAELVDEAFLRRMAYKVGIRNPSPEAFGRILAYECERNGIPLDARAAPYLLQLFGKRPLRGSHPKQIVSRLVDMAAFRGQTPRLTPQTLREAFDECFNPALGDLAGDDWARPTQIPIKVNGTH